MSTNRATNRSTKPPSPEGKATEGVQPPDESLSDGALERGEEEPGGNIGFVLPSKNYIPKDEKRDMITHDNLNFQEF